jgi:hypothetical protein
LCPERSDFLSIWEDSAFFDGFDGDRHIPRPIRR